VLSRDDIGRHVGFPVHRDTVELDARVGGRQRFAMVSDDDPATRTGFDGRFDEVVKNELFSSSGAWDGIPGQAEAWPSNLRVEFHDQDGKTRLVVREGPHPARHGRPGPPGVRDDAPQTGVPAQRLISRRITSRSRARGGVWRCPRRQDLVAHSWPKRRFNIWLNHAEPSRLSAKSACK
jgi:uncharacterized protein YndB with AHSA1/START domain